MPLLGKLDALDTSGIVRGHAHGFQNKDMIVLHETVSPDAPGFSDITGVEQYLASKDYGIHGMTDADGNVAWAHGFGRAIFWQAGGVNERSVGIEQVSRVMLDYQGVARQTAVWAGRVAQLNATAKLVAAIVRFHPGIPLVESDGTKPGVTSHYQVSQHFPASEGHTDCHPTHLGGYYPLRQVIALAKRYRLLGY